MRVVESGEVVSLVAIHDYVLVSMVDARNEHAWSLLKMAWHYQCASMVAGLTIATTIEFLRCVYLFCIDSSLN